MAGKRRLVLLTLSYPFGESEPFLETELAYLSQGFSVEIIPCVSGPELGTRRRVPAGVVVREEVVRKILLSLARKTGWLFIHPGSLIDIITLLFGELREIGFRWSRFRGFMGFAVHAAMTYRLLKTLRRPDEIGCIYSYWLSIPMAWRVFKKSRPGISVITRAHGVDLYAERAPRHYLPGQKQIIENVDKVFCVSEHGANYLKEKYPNQRSRIKVSRLGVPGGSARNIPPNDGKLHIVSCSYLVPVKRVSLIIEALSRSNIPIAWTHLGGGDLEDMLRNMASRLLHENVQWTITGAISNREVLRFYRENPVDIFLNVSSSEGLPVSIMEAMSYGIPVAATDAGGTRELVTHGKNGYLWPVDISPEGIAKTLAAFFRISGGAKQAMRTAAWETWREKVCAENQFQRFIQNVQDVCSGDITVSGAVSV